jgi:serine/threonine protein kinase
MIKPDGVQRGLVGAIIKRFETKGFKLVAMKMASPSKEHIETHYADLKSKKFFAVKGFSKKHLIKTDAALAKAGLTNELKIMKLLDHPNIVRLHEMYESRHSIYLILDLVDGKTLTHILKAPTFSASVAQKLMKELIHAIHYLHSKDIMHRDLKPENIMVDATFNIKLIDFGLASRIRDTHRVYARCGTPGYLAPEIFVELDGKNIYEKCDMFSLGCVFYYMLFKAPFFPGIDHQDVLRQNRYFNLDNQAVETIANECTNPHGLIPKNALLLLAELLDLRPSDRISSSEAMDHPYVCPRIVKMINGRIISSEGDIPAIAFSHQTKETITVKEKTLAEEGLLSKEALEQPSNPIEDGLIQFSNAKKVFDVTKITRISIKSKSFSSGSSKTNLSLLSKAKIKETTKSILPNYNIQDKSTNGAKTLLLSASTTKSGTKTELLKFRMDTNSIGYESRPLSSDYIDTQKTGRYFNPIPPRPPKKRTSLLMKCFCLKDY